ncbi:ABC transporter permease [Streptomyces iconiensis]|uniref:ABC transporter permease n=1 Tax=Streptomyces iconiensis TaxID=1384038 RepID=A0ABT7A0S1_9ACTN|nr:ABC transporter permease [Streptomyces iconiensis]MDJ1134932.1 ABC transporter permease [Streptomyces iconiensis]
MTATTALPEPGTAAPPAPPPPAGGSLTRALLRDRTAVISTGFLLLLCLLALCAPLVSQLTGNGPYTFDSAALDSHLGGVPHGALGGISAEHPLGVEPQNGRDILARVLYGARVSLTIALSSTVLTGCLGVVLGMTAGYFKGWVDQVVSRLMDFLMSFPALIFMIAILSSVPSGNRSVLLVAVISLFGWPYFARVIRAQTMTLAGREFVEAAHASGARSAAVLFREILPNLRSSVIVMVTLAVPGYIGTEAGLSFLGVGVSPPTPSWGQMISTSVSWYAVDPMFFVIPGALLFSTVLSLTVLGDRLRAVTDAQGAR